MPTRSSRTSVGRAQRAPRDERRIPIATQGSSRPDGLQASTIHRVLTSSHRIAEHLNSECEQAGVSLPLARALQFLAEANGPVTPTQLSRELGRSPAATSELVKRLINTGRITADVDPKDRRSFLLALTGSGRAKWYEVRTVLRGAESAIERDYGKRRLTDLAGAVEELVAKLDGAAD